MQAIMQGVQQLLPLLTVFVASSANVSAAVADLQRRAVSMQGVSAEAAAHLRHLKDAVEALRSSAAGKQDVQKCLAALHDSTQQLHEEGVPWVQVLDSCSALQDNLSRGVARLTQSLNELQGEVASFSRLMASAQQELTHLTATVKEMKEILRHQHALLCSVTQSAATNLKQTGGIQPAGVRSR